MEKSEIEPVDLDLNRDGVIDRHDIEILLAHYGTKRGDPNFLYFLDFNEDGEIDILDVIAMTVLYGKQI